MSFNLFIFRERLKIKKIVENQSLNLIRRAEYLKGTVSLGRIVNTC